MADSTVVRNEKIVALDTPRNFGWNELNFRRDWTDGSIGRKGLDFWITNSTDELRNRFETSDVNLSSRMMTLSDCVEFATTFNY